MSYPTADPPTIVGRTSGAGGTTPYACTNGACTDGTCTDVRLRQFIRLRLPAVNGSAVVHGLIPAML